MKYYYFLIPILIGIMVGSFLVLYQPQSVDSKILTESNLIENGSPNGPAKVPCGGLFLIFFATLSFICILCWIWLTLGSLLEPFGSLWVPFGSLLDIFWCPWAHCWYSWATFKVWFQPFISVLLLGLISTFPFRFVARNKCKGPALSCELILWISIWILS